jgi:hypothetical protein
MHPVLINPALQVYFMVVDGCNEQCRVTKRLFGGIK